MVINITRSKLETDERLYWYACHSIFQFYVFNFCFCDFTCLLAVVILISIFIHLLLFIGFIFVVF